MENESKTYDQLVDEVHQLRQRLAELEVLAAGRGVQAEQVAPPRPAFMLDRMDLEEIGEREIARVRRYGHPLSVIAFGIDSFDAITARHGSDSAEIVLNRIAAVVSEQIRMSDSLFRMDAESEFLLLLPETDAAEARLIAERLQDIIQEVKIPLQGGQISVTACAGAATCAIVEEGFSALRAQAEDSLRAARP